MNADAVVATLSAQGGTSPFTYALEADETNGVDNASFKIEGFDVKVNTTPLVEKDYKINIPFLMIIILIKITLKNIQQFTI